MSQESPASQAIDGFFIHFSPAERKRLMEVLEHDGYTQDLEGLKKYILDSLDEDEEEKYEERDPTVESLARTLRENPQVLLNVGIAAHGLLRKALSKVKPS